MAIRFRGRTKVDAAASELVLIHDHDPLGLEPEVACQDRQHAQSVAGARRVAEKQANPYGFYDLLGNVWEWCADTWHDSYEGAPDDGSAWIDEGAANRVVRGGSFSDTAPYVRSACRLGSDPGDRLVNLGFRCARVQVSGEAECRAGRGKR